MANVVEIVLRAVDKTKDGFTSPIRNLNDLGKSLDKIKPAVLTLGATFVTAFGVMSKAAINLAAEQGKMAEKAGTTVEQFSALAYVGELANVQAEKLTKSYKELSQLLNDSEKTGSKSAAMFHEFGLSVRDADGQLVSAGEAMMNIADRFASMEDGAEKVAMATKLFGDKLGQDLIPFLNQGAQAIRETQAEALMFGQVISTKTAKAASEFNDQLTKLKKIAQGVVNMVVAEFLPASAEMLKSFVEWIKRTSAIEFVTGTLVDTLKVLAYVSKLVAVTVQSLGDIFVGIGKTIGNIAATFVSFWEMIGTGLGKTVALIEELLKGNFENAKMIAKEGVAATLGEFEVFKEGVENIGKEASDSWNKAMERMAAGPTAPEFGEHQMPNGDILVNKEGEEEAITQLHQKYTTMRELIDEAYAEGQIARLMALQQTEQAMELQRLDERKQFLSAYMTFYQEAHRGAFSYIAQAGMAVYQGIGNAITSIIMGAQSAGEAFKALGKQMVAMVVNFIAQRAVAWALEKAFAAIGLGIMKAAVVANVGAASALAAAWAPAATAAAIATFGGALVPGAAVPKLMAVNAVAGSAIAMAGSVGGIAHGGLTNVPEESTYILQRGERVLSPNQNQDLQQFMDERGAGVTSIAIYLDGEILGKGVGKLSRDGRLIISASSVI